MNKTAGSFKRDHEFGERVNSSERAMSMYPDRVPVILERSESANMPAVDKVKYLVPRDITVGEFVYIIRKRIKLEPERALFVFIHKILPPTSQSIGEVYDLHKDKDNFLYVEYRSENTFGM